MFSKTRDHLATLKAALSFKQRPRTLRDITKITNGKSRGQLRDRPIAYCEYHLAFR